MTSDSSKSPLKRLLRQLGLLSFARQVWSMVRWLTDSEFRQREREQRRKFVEFCRGRGRLFADEVYRPDKARPAVLVVNTGPHGLLVELALVKACELGGFRPIILAGYDRWTARYYRHAHIRAIHYWEDFLEPCDQGTVTALLAPVKTFQELVALQYQGIRVGKYATSTALRHLRVGRLDPSVPATRQAVLPFLSRAIQCTVAAKRIISELKPRLALTIDVGYSPRGELFDVCRSSGIDTITWNAAHKNNALMLKRYHVLNQEVHPASLSHETWKWLSGLPWDAGKQKILRQEIVGSYERGEWYSEVGTQFHTATQTAADVRSALSLDPAKKTVGIFPHIFWDGTFFWGTDLFGSYEEWFVETMKVAYENPQVNWVVKIHPANIVKNVRDGVGSEPSEWAAIRSLGPLPSHVRVIEPDSRMSTLSLFAVMDYCVTVRGTVGIEAASFGIPVLTAGTGRYDRLGFTTDSESRQQYLQRLANIQDLAPLTPQQRELAERFAYGIFVERPFRLESVTLEYQRDAKASLSTKVSLEPTHDLRSAPDLKAFAEWVRSGQEDFVAAQTRVDMPLQQGR